MTVEQNCGSFRDPANKVYEIKNHENDHTTHILRGINEQTLSNYKDYLAITKLQHLRDSGDIVQSKLLSKSDPLAVEVLADGWAACIQHEVIPFISYPYEWSFSMLKDAALLQLKLIETSIECGWTLKDATPYNLQWTGCKPTFIDEPSFEPWNEGEPWVGYRQFCSMFLTPLLLKKHLDIDYLPLIRSSLNGIPPLEATKYFTGLNCLKKGVLSHIILPAKVENKIVNRERDNKPARKRTTIKHSNTMILGLVQSLNRLVSNLSVPIKHTDWSQYDKTHSYADSDFEIKKQFVQKQISDKHYSCAWDIGCNTGTYSKIICGYADSVISIDGDHNAIEQLYESEKNEEKSNILPLVVNLANISPSQGWAGKERQAFDERGKPDFVLCLALIHHLRITENIPNILFLQWLRSLDANIVLEFVNRDDEMVVKLLTNKKEQYDDYNYDQFISETTQYFNIIDQVTLKNGKRELLYLTPK